MAVNKTIFTADRTAQKSEILSWLQANATDYFDQIAENSGNIECSLENGAKLTVVFDDTTVIYKIDSKTGVSHSIYGSSTLKYTKAGVVTSKGIMIVGALSASSDNIIIISKTGENSTAVSCYIKSSSSSSALINYFIDLGNDADWLGNSSNSLRYSVPATSLSPVCFSCGTYCEHVFLTPFTQFENTCIMQINSKKYAYGGYLALEE